MLPQDEAFRQTLRELGYVEGRNLVIEYRWAAGQQERLAEMAAELVRLKVDVIVGAGTTVITAAKRATTSTPIVMASVADPVGAGLVASLARPGGNVTGMTLLSTELAGKRLQLIHELQPKVTVVGILAFRGRTTRQLLLEEMRAAAPKVGVEVTVRLVSAAGERPDAIAGLKGERAQAMVVQASQLTTDNAGKIAELAQRHRLPALYEARGFVDAGGLVCYGPNVPELYRRAATYVDKILKGAKPADLPVEQPTTFELVINLKAAKALGLTVPPALLARADQVIQ